MTINELLTTLHDLPLAAAVRGESGWDWLFPIVEIVHVCALALVFGSILMVDLRLVGLSSPNSKVSRLTQELLPYTWVAFAIAAISGSMLFISKAPIYFGNLQFRIKFLLMFLAGLNMLAFHFGIYRRVAQWDQALPPPLAARLAGAASIALWVAVIFMGRWVGFTT